MDSPPGYPLFTLKIFLRELPCSKIPGYSNKAMIPYFQIISKFSVILTSNLLILSAETRVKLSTIHTMSYWSSALMIYALLQ